MPQAHVGDTACDPDLRVGRERDHGASTTGSRRANAFGSIKAGTVIRRPFRSAISIVASGIGAATGCDDASQTAAGAALAATVTAVNAGPRLIPPAYVKPFVKRGKTDAADAEAICEAVTRKTMRFVPVKTEEQQATAKVLKTRELLVGQRTRTINALRAHLAELGVVAATAVTGFANLVAIIRDHDDNRVPKVARFALAILVEAVEMVEQQIAEIEERIAVATRSDESAKRLMSIPGVRVIIAVSIRALVPDPAGFRSARHFAAWLGLTPKPHSSGGKERLGGISKMGNATLRSLLVVGATSVTCVARRGKPVPAWLSDLMSRRPFKVAAVAFANKMARIIWSLLTKGGIYRPPVMAAA